MRESDPLSRAARAAIARAKRRGAEEVTPDDLLAAALEEVARFGVALVGPWAIDATDLDIASTSPESSTGERGPPPVGTDGPDADTDAPPVRGPHYSDAAVAVFEEAARLARQEGAPTLGLVHLLAALGEREEGIMLRLREGHGFTPLEWRTALARGELGPPAADGDRDGRGPGHGASEARPPELLGVDQAASFLGVHAQTVRNYIRAGKLPAYRLAGERFIRVLRRDLLGLLEPVAAHDAQEVETELPVNLSSKE